MTIPTFHFCCQNLAATQYSLSFMLTRSAFENDLDLNLKIKRHLNLKMTRETFIKKEQTIFQKFLLFFSNIYQYITEKIMIVILTCRSRNVIDIPTVV